MIRKNKIVFALFFCNLFFTTYAQNKKTPDFSIMFYNVENLFDTIDDKTKNDNEFIPTSAKKWNSYQYYSKLKHISQVITAAGEWHNPDIIGMCEIENESCLWGLTHNTNLSRFQYKFIHYDSPDDRGIDVALLYNPKTFIPITSRPIQIHFPNAPQSKTRDILYVKGIMKTSNDTLHMFVCHFPSRRGGQVQSDPKRLYVAQILRQTIDSIQKTNTNANICIIGDFNDYPTSTSISKVLQASTEKQNCETCLTNVIDKTAEGTHKFKGKWNFLDQSIVSNALYKNYELENSVLDLDFLLEKESKLETVKPFRTYTGNYYHGGYSDHLPIIVKLYKK